MLHFSTALRQRDIRAQADAAAPGEVPRLHPSATLGGEGVRMLGGVHGLARMPVDSTGGELLLLTAGVDGRLIAWGRSPDVLLEGAPPLGPALSNGHQIVAVDGAAYVQAGAGIVADSDPATEYEETLNKARALLRAASMVGGGSS